MELRLVSGLLAVNDAQAMGRSRGVQIWAKTIVHSGAEPARPHEWNVAIGIVLANASRTIALAMCDRRHGRGVGDGRLRVAGREIAC